MSGYDRSGADPYFSHDDFRRKAGRILLTEEQKRRLDRFGRILNLARGSSGAEQRNAWRRVREQIASFADSRLLAEAWGKLESSEWSPYLTSPIAAGPDGQDCRSCRFIDGRGLPVCRRYPPKGDPHYLEFGRDYCHEYEPRVTPDWMREPERSAVSQDVRGEISGGDP